MTDPSLLFLYRDFQDMLSRGDEVIRTACSFSKNFFFNYNRKWSHVDLVEWDDIYKLIFLAPPLFWWHCLYCLFTLPNQLTAVSLSTSLIHVLFLFQTDSWTLFHFVLTKPFIQYKCVHIHPPSTSLAEEYLICAAPRFMDNTRLSITGHNPLNAIWHSAFSYQRW